LSTFVLQLLLDYNIIHSCWFLVGSLPSDYWPLTQLLNVVLVFDQWSSIVGCVLHVLVCVDELL